LKSLIVPAVEKLKSVLGITEDTFDLQTLIEDTAEAIGVKTLHDVAASVTEEEMAIAADNLLGFALTVALPQSEFNPTTIKAFPKRIFANLWRNFIASSDRYDFRFLERSTNESDYGRLMGRIFQKLIPIIAAAITGTDFPPKVENKLAKLFEETAGLSSQPQVGQKRNRLGEPIAPNSLNHAVGSITSSAVVQPVVRTVPSDARKTFIE
jgi:hypothetical protein